MCKKWCQLYLWRSPKHSQECSIHRNCLTTLFWTCGKGFTEQIFCFYAILIDICLWDSWFFCPDSELLMLAPCLGHSDFIIQAPSSNKASLQPVRSSSFFSQARVDMVYFINHRNGQAISAGKKKKTLQKNMVVFSELQVPKHNLIRHCSQKETDCLLLNSRNSHYLAPTVWLLEPKKKTSDSPSAKSGFAIFQRPALQSKICG